MNPEERKFAADSLKNELQTYEKAGTHLYLDGYPSKADEIVSACLLAEDSAYMRDFIGDGRDCITEIHFVKIAEEQEYERKEKQPEHRQSPYVFS